MKQSLIQFLICPKCSGEIKEKIKKQTKNEIIEGKLICQKCNEKYPILKGIPRFVIDKSKDFIKTEDAFSKKWNVYHKSYHESKWFNFQLNWYIDRFNLKSYQNLKNFLKTRKFILDAGTGLGNSAKYHSSNKNAIVFAVDASESIDYAKKKYGKEKNIHFIQADLRQLPFKKKFFDFIVSDQVLHHTKNTKTSFKYLTRFLVKKGLISIYVYNKKAPMREFADDFIRSKTTKMSAKECIEFSRDMTTLGKALSELNKKIKIPRNIPLLKIKAGTYDVQRFIYWHFLKCYWAEDKNMERSIGVNFDWYFPKFAFRHTPLEVKKWFKETKITITSFKEIESGISVTGIKK